MKRLAILLALLAAGCAGSSEKETKPARELGERLFRDPDLSNSQFNYFACSDCHAATAAEEANQVFAGLPMENVANRTFWWNGYTPQLLDAVNTCLVFFMRGEPIENGDPGGDALYEYLASISTTTSSGQTLSWVRNIQALVPTDPVRGQEVYDAACRLCHGDPATGRGRVSPTTTILGPELSAFYDAEFPGVLHDTIVVEKVRHGQFFGIGGNMPPFAPERLSDEDLAALIAYLDL